jgi:pyridinium-3,5-bisthiocarboxylic acid mononucleotide nickel chelatase
MTADTGTHQGAGHVHPHPHPHGHTVSDGHSQETHAHSASEQGDGVRPVVSSGSERTPHVCTRLVYVDCFAGASGDMLLGALVDAGLSLDALKAELAKLALDGYEIVAARIGNHGLTGTQLSVRDTLHAYPARHLHDIQELIGDSALSDAVKARSLAVIERLGRAEAGIHGVPLQEVHFHEIGAVDTIVDVVGFVAGLELLGIQQVYASAIPLGNGTIQTVHGRLPVPAPATLALLSSVGAPTLPHPAQTEIVTPTGAALLCELALFERPRMRVRAVGYGFGQKEFPWANGLRVWIGETDEPPRRPQNAAPRQLLEGERAEIDHVPGAFSESERGSSERDEVVVLECNLDDSTGETLGYTMERLFAAGALDVWFTPIQMKKNRPGVLLSALSVSDKVDALSSILLRETSTLGIRLFAPVHRLKASRHVRQVSTPWGVVRVKEKWLGEGAQQASGGHGAPERIAISPEYEDCARLARESGEPLVRVMGVARQIAEQDGQGTSGENSTFDHTASHSC